MKTYLPNLSSLTLTDSEGNEYPAPWLNLSHEGKELQEGIDFEIKYQVLGLQTKYTEWTDVPQEHFNKSRPNERRIITLPIERGSAMEGETFEDYMRNARNEFVNVINSHERSVALKVACEDILICFDQMRYKLTTPPPVKGVEGAGKELKFTPGKLYPWGHFLYYTKWPDSTIGYVFNNCGKVHTYTNEQVAGGQDETTGKEKSEIYNQIHSIVKKLKLKETTGDSYDHSSVSYELEQLFLAGASWKSTQGNESDGWVSVETGYPTPADGDKKGMVLGWDKFQNEAHKCSIQDIAQMKMRFTHWQPLPSNPTIQK